jgi:hypothetical protein
MVWLHWLWSRRMPVVFQWLLICFIDFIWIQFNVEMNPTCCISLLFRQIKCHFKKCWNSRWIMPRRLFFSCHRFCLNPKIRKIESQTPHDCHLRLIVALRHHTILHPRCFSQCESFSSISFKWVVSNELLFKKYHSLSSIPLEYND